ncbi:hypothetical protein CD201_18325 [Hafnia alvei]|uniref:DUF1488 domain-containing protein n=1 Tax=Hafnia alvei TaxID=569 RepID=UPI000DAAD7F2|nr:DUF1488 domain-containing protein [Hafnia alvei]AWV46394.1 hypothetical protein CD201_18325 [Hafnia alvei]MEB7889746.1 DUF1488 domain-containing protein [Hafnia alvei]
MNQAIQFPDQEEWDVNKKAVLFPATINGFRISCAIYIEELKRMSEERQNVDPLVLFRSLRWDLEDIAEHKILNEDYSDDGWVWISG